MIRRELRLSDDARVWLLVSQVQHARVSGNLVAHWREKLSQDVIDAISHHDDGWATWEEEPRLDPKTGAPVSFLEMRLGESLVIWDHSIAAARQLSSLGGYIVAGHFYNLLADSEHANEQAAIGWLTAKRKVRTAWLDEWIRADKSHSLDYAKHSQQMLLTADLFSLWLVGDCPIEEKTDRILDNSAMKVRNSKFLKEFHFVSPECTLRESVSKHRVEGLSWIVPMDPFPFEEAFSVATKSVMVPVAKYEKWEDLAAASWPVELIWQLVPAVAATSAET
jgi:hypothetical protein